MSPAPRERHQKWVINALRSLGAAAELIQPLGLRHMRKEDCIIKEEVAGPLSHASPHAASG